MSETIITLLIGAFLGAILKHFYEKKSKLFEQSQEYKKTRYLVVILLLEALINYDKSFNKLKSHRSDITSKEELIEEIKAEYNMMYVYSSEDILLKMNEFIKNPSTQTFLQVSLSMRKDLWNIKTSKKLIEFINKESNI